MQVGGCRAWVGRRPTGLAWLGLAAVVVCRCPWNRDESEGVLLLLLLLLQYNSSIPSIPAVSHALWGVWWVEEGEGQWEGSIGRGKGQGRPVRQHRWAQPRICLALSS